MEQADLIVVRALEQSDIDGLLRLYNERSVAEMTLQSPYRSKDEIDARIAPNPNLKRLVALVDGEIAGDGGLHLEQRRRKHVGGIGMAVRESYRGMGVGNAILSALLDLADNWHGLARVELEVYVDNVPAIRLYEKYGFVIEGTHRAYALRNGHFVDAHSMARLRELPRIADSTSVARPADQP